MLKTAFENLRSRCPLIHNITNYVTVNDCANMVLACGASPIMADDAAEVMWIPLAEIDPEQFGLRSIREGLYSILKHLR